MARTAPLVEQLPNLVGLAFRIESALRKGAIHQRMLVLAGALGEPMLRARGLPLDAWAAIDVPPSSVATFEVSATRLLEQPRVAPGRTA